ncbi:hypothetical protein [Peribacillus muralis]|uniref:hypothetical protein n=1 Tax=Peribacillus muralis TaxID=264697 RepID=UPI00366F4908
MEDLIFKRLDGEIDQLLSFMTENYWEFHAEPKPTKEQIGRAYSNGWYYKCGFVNEGYLRRAWENTDGSVSDSICYATIRYDWENKILKPIEINDHPF